LPAPAGCGAPLAAAQGALARAVGRRREARNALARAATGEGDEAGADPLLAEARAAAEAARQRLAVAQGVEAAPGGVPDATAAAGVGEAFDSVDASAGAAMATPGQAVVASATLRRAVTTLLRLRRGPGGAAALGALAARACTALEEEGEVDWTALVSDEAAWQEAGMSVEEAATALREAARRCVPSTDFVEEVKISRRDGSEIEGEWRFGRLTLTLQKSETQALWGEISSWEAGFESPPALVGWRAVRPPPGVERGKGVKKPEELGKGDKLRLAAPDRAALMELVLYDRLPEKYKGLAALIELQEKIQAQGGDTDAEGVRDIQFIDPKATKVVEDPEVRAAVRFFKRLELIPSAGEKNRERLRRLQEMPLARQIAAAAAADSEWAELGRALQESEEPLVERLYAAMRGAQMDGVLSEDEKVSVIDVELNLFQILGALVVIAALAFGAANLTKSALRQGTPNQASESLPMYTLKGKGAGAV